MTPKASQAEPTSPGPGRSGNPASSPPAGASATAARQLAFQALQDIDRGAFSDVALDRALRRSPLSDLDKRLLTELVYGTVRRQRTLDALIGQYGKRPARAQSGELRQILRLGFYQLRYMGQVPPHAVVYTSVELAKAKRLGKLSGVVNGMLRAYIREAGEPASAQDPLVLPSDVTARLGILHSYPDWIIELWRSILPEPEVVALCEWFNQPPALDLRINLQRYSRAEAMAIFGAAGIASEPLAAVPSALRLQGHFGAIRQLPGYAEGWWAVQDASAQLVSYLLDPQPGETIIDACAAPGGKSLHIAELMGDQGKIWSCDRTPSRTRKIQQNLKRAGLTSITPITCDSRHQPTFAGKADRVLLDVPCSGLGTLHRHADARWRQSPESVAQLVALQQQLLTEAASWVKPNGCLVYATCTLHPAENEGQIQSFLQQHPDWQIASPPADWAALATAAGWISIWPHRHPMDGFFMVKLVRSR